MIDLEKLGDDLSALRREMVALGMPHTLVDRIDAVHSMIPNIEHARERRKQ